ncbi:MAG: beta-ketoacyl-[acyl-carrier-protein] synthase family protein [Elusimicrobia bacterium]|nr:beta-ketoacyl-[acyl-carrier-protein] synthase family protein [Elusimicrobiota bacterium]
MTDARRVVVTGIGLVTPLGADRETTWRNVLSGASGVKEGRASAPVNETSSHRAIHFALVAAREALTESDCLQEALGETWGCTVSSSKPLLSDGEGARSLILQEPDIVPRTVSRTFGVQGPVVNLSAACATGAQSVMVGAEWIREGRCERVLAGSAESSLHPLFLSGFSQLGVLSESGQVRPFDRRRDGFVIGEGAAVFVLESLASARRRGAPVCGEVLGWDFSCDAHHATRFNGDGRRIAGSLLRALRKASVTPESVGYVNAHGTATLLNDRLEARALLSVFQGRDTLKVSSTKGATGHLLGAAGSVETAFCLLALRDQMLPPTLNLSESESTAIDFVPIRACAWDIHTSANLSFGFGGAIASLIMGKEAP